MLGQRSRRSRPITNQHQVKTTRVCWVYYSSKAKECLAPFSLFKWTYGALIAWTLILGQILILGSILHSWHPFTSRNSYRFTWPIYVTDTWGSQSYLEYVFKKKLVWYVSLIVLVYIDSLKKYVGKSINSIGQWGCNFQATPPNWIELRLANHNLKTWARFWPNM